MSATDRTRAFQAKRYAAARQEITLIRHRGKGYQVTTYEIPSGWRLPANNEHSEWIGFPVLGSQFYVPQCRLGRFMDRLRALFFPARPAIAPSRLGATNPPITEPAPQDNLPGWEQDTSTLFRPSPGMTGRLVIATLRPLSGPAGHLLDYPPVTRRYLQIHERGSQHGVLIPCCETEEADDVSEAGADVAPACPTFSTTDHESAGEPVQSRPIQRPCEDVPSPDSTPDPVAASNPFPTEEGQP